MGEADMTEGTDDFLRLLAAWALVHETADEGWKAAVERGASVGPEGMGGGPDAFVDGLSAMVAAEKERLKAALAAGETAVPGSGGERSAQLDEVRFELGEVRSRLEAIETALDALARRLDARDAAR
jgi:hypothetical protein